MRRQRLRFAVIAATVVFGGLAATALAVAGTASASYKAKITGGVLTFTGNAASDKLVLRLKPGGETKLQGDVGGNGTAEFEFGRGLFTSIVVNAGGGNDAVVVSEANGVFTTTEATTLNGGGGKDKLTGGTGGEALRGGPGADKVSGKGGPDTFFWKASDGNDTINGQGDSDTVSFTGTPTNNSFALRASSGSLRADVGFEAVVAQAVEGANVSPLDGLDSVDVNDLTGTGVSAVNIDLGVTGVADAVADTVTVDATGGSDAVSIAASSAQVVASGLPVNLAISGASPSDRLTVNGLGGGDTLSGGGLATLIQLTLDGGDGIDSLNGGNGADILLGGNQNDGVDGNGGNDTVFLGDGNDTAHWDPGDGSDVVEGQTGNDLLDFNGAAAAEIFALSSNGGRLLFTRNVGNIVMDTDDVEVVNLHALGGIDTVTVNDLGPTDVTSVVVDLGVGGLGDASVDAITVNATNAVDLFNVSGSAGSVLVQGLAVGVQLLSSEPANDTLTVNLINGDDIFSAASLAATSLQHLTVSGGNGNDILVGSQGADALNGDANTDYIDGGAGIDSSTGGETVVNVP